MAAMSADEMATFERYCDQLYSSPSAAERAKAEQALVQLSTSAAYLPQCQAVIAGSSQPYAQLVAANAMRKLLAAHWSHLAPAQRLGVRNFLLGHLASHGVGLAHFVIASLVQTVATVTKLGWLEEEAHQHVVSDVSKFLHASAEHMPLGLQASVHPKLTPALSSRPKLTPWP